MILQFELDAWLEYRDAAIYPEQRFGLGEELVQAVESALAMILSDPERFQPVGQGVRIIRLKRFPYYLFYHHSPENACITIYAVAHHGRKPDYWRGRQP